MPNTHHTALRIAIVAIPALLMASAATAQNAAQDGRLDRPDLSNGPSTTGMGPPHESEWQAPIGHRQPRATDRPSDTGPVAGDAIDDRINRINRDAGRGLTICRNC